MNSRFWGVTSTKELGIKHKSNDFRISTRGTHAKDVYILDILIAEGFGLNMNFVRAIAKGHMSVWTRYREASQRSYITRYGT